MNYRRAITEVARVRLARPNGPRGARTCAHLDDFAIDNLHWLTRIAIHKNNRYYVLPLQEQINMMKAEIQSQLLGDTQRFVQRAINLGEFVEVMVDFFDDDQYHQIEGDGRTFGSKQEVIDFEKEALKKVAKYHGGTIGPIGVSSDDGKGNGITFAEYSFKIEDHQGVVAEIEQVQVSTWKSGKIVRNRYYYNPAE